MSDQWDDGIPRTVTETAWRIEGCGSSIPLAILARAADAVPAELRDTAMVSIETDYDGDVVSIEIEYQRIRSEAEVERIKAHTAQASG